MKVISIQSQKGGAGKTTLAVHLASAAVARGLSVRVLDADEQKSALLWASSMLLLQKTTSITHWAASGGAVDNAHFTLC